ncbi:MAG TPA: DUF6491 family protein [Rhizomicrobium sp.]|jgi:hypothetical protein|nr:DUF6491 family protein [Rhizomicrobium sp.]
MRIAVFALFALCIPFTAQAQPQAMAPDKSSAVCLRQNMVLGWKVVDNQTLIVTDKVQKAYKVSLRPGCFDLKWPMRLGFKSFSGSGLSCLARNDYVVVPPQPGFPAQRCLISDVVAYTPPPIPPR